MVRIRRFGVIATANVAAIIYLIMTAIFAIPFALILSAAPMTTTDQFGRTVDIGLSPLFVLFIPIFYAAVGWIFTAIGCLIYNLAARVTGGVEFDAVTVSQPVASVPPPPATTSGPEAPGQGGTRPDAG
jgi:hypothetical protein